MAHQLPRLVTDHHPDLPPELLDDDASTPPSAAPALSAPPMDDDIPEELRATTDELGLASDVQAAEPALEAAPAEQTEGQQGTGSPRFEPGNELWKRRDHAAHADAVRAALQRRVSLEKVLLDCVTPDDARAIIVRLMSIVVDGAAKDAVRAAQTLLNVLVPKRPAQAGEVGRPHAGGGGSTFVFQLATDPVEAARRRVANTATD